MRLLAELNRRNVVRMAGLYLVVSWLIVQIAETLLPAFDVPVWVLRAVIILLAIGFVPAVVVSWIFELTPEGLKREQGSEDQPSLAPRMNRLIVVGLIGVIAMMAVERVWLANSPSTAPSPEMALAADETNKAKAHDVMSHGVVPGIAVLPFSNLSSDPENAFFAGGIYAEVLTQLARIGELRIISRTSMERIAEEKLEVSAIGLRLGVSHVLEGSVRREASQIRVTVQLIEAATDAHVFAENYDRTLDDVFAIQSEIALAIASQLELTLSPQLVSDLSERPTSSPAAYELYLRAIEHRQVWRGSAGFLDLIKLLELAVALDPAFLSAEVLLAEAYGRMHWTGADPDGSYRAKAAKLIDYIKERWSGRPEAALASAQFSYNVERDYASALDQYQQLAVSLPHNVDVMFGIAASLKRLNRNEEFLQAARRAVAANPESPLANRELLVAHHANKLYAEGVALSELVLERLPDDESNLVVAALLKVNRDIDLKPLLDLPLGTNGDYAESRSIARFSSGDVDGAIDALEARTASSPLQAALHGASLARLLKLVGRNGQADRLAKSAFEVVLANIDTPTPPVGMGTAEWYAIAASVAGLAEERETALRWQLRSAAAPEPFSMQEREWLKLARSDAQLALGNAEAAFLIRQPLIATAFPESERFMLAARPYYDALYGASPSYRIYMTKIAEQIR